MNTLIVKSFVAALVSLGVVSCATVSKNPVAREATPQAYANSQTTKGVVIVAVNWGRRWNCGGFENAQILNLGFDRLPIKDTAANSKSEVILDGPPRVMVDPVFSDYAILLEPGEYALTSFDIKVARSVQDVGHFVANRSHLIKDGKPEGGSFQVKAGEVVYIGNFYLDCQTQPMIWRYYTEGREPFRSHMRQVKQKYPFIDPDKVAYRLFRTSNLGVDYELPAP